MQKCSRPHLLVYKIVLNISSSDKQQQQVRLVKTLSQNFCYVNQTNKCLVLSARDGHGIYVNRGKF